MAGYFIGIHRYLHTRKAILTTVYSAEFNTMALNSKLSKLVSYIQENKAWERIYIKSKTISPCFRVLCIADSSKEGMDKLFYYDRMTKTFIIKSLSDFDNKELSPVYGSSSQKVWVHQIVTLMKPISLG